MKPTLPFLFVVLTAGMVRAGAIGAYGGRVNTADFGSARGLGLKLETQVISILALDLRGGWVSGFKDKTLGVDDFEWYSLEVGAQFRMPLGEWVSVHAGAGAGYYIMPGFDAVLEDGSTRRSNIDDTPGGYARIGLEAGTRRIRLFAEAQYLLLEPDTVRADFLEPRVQDIDTDLSGVHWLFGAALRW